jgi:hypothetical protein
VRPFYFQALKMRLYYGRLRTARLLEHLPDIKLADLLRQIAQRPKWGSFDDPCEAGYSPSSRIEAR